MTPYLWDGTQLRPVTILGIWDGFSLVKLQGDPIFNGFGLNPFGLSPFGA